MTVSVNFEGTTFTPLYRIHKGRDAKGPWRHLAPLKGQPLVKPGSGFPPGKIVKTGRQGLASVPGMVDFDSILEITDVDTFLRAHDISRVSETRARKSVANRRITHLTATPRNPGGFSYQIFIDEERKFVLGMKEMGPQNRLCHCFEYRTILYLDEINPSALGTGLYRINRPGLTPEEAAKILGVNIGSILPTATPPGFDHCELLKTNALETISMRFSNGTSTGVILLVLRKSHFQDIHFRPGPPSGPSASHKKIKGLVQNGHAFVDGQYIGLTYEISGFSCVELHTSTKSILAMSSAGLDLVKELVTYLPLP